MKLLITLRSEFLKIRRTTTFYLSVLGGAIVPLLLLLEFATEENVAKQLQHDPWNNYFQEGWNGLNYVFFPMFLILITTMLAQMEFRNGTWKQLFASPQSLLSIFTAKYLVIQFLVLLFLVSYNLFMATTAAALDYFNPGGHFFEHQPDWKRLALSNAKIYITFLSISTFQYWISTRYKNFITPMAIGICCWMAAAMLVFEIGFKQAHLFPFANPNLLTLSSLNQSHFPLLETYEWSSLGFTALFLVLGFIDLDMRKEKG